MNENSIFRVSIEVPQDVDLVLDDIETIRDLENDIDELLRVARPIVLDFRVSPRPGISIVDASELVRERARLLGRGLPISIHVRSTRALEAVQSAIARGSEHGRWAKFGGISVEVRNCSITDVRADAAVNASNTQLHLGGGVSGALRRAAGPRLQHAMSKLAPIGERSLVSTPSFDHRKVASIMHVPTATGAGEVVRAAYRNVLQFATTAGLRSVVLPSLGTGTGNMLPETSARILREELEQFAASGDHGWVFTLIVAAYESSVADVFASQLGAE